MDANKGLTNRPDPEVIERMTAAEIQAELDAQPYMIQEFPAWWRALTLRLYALRDSERLSRCESERRAPVLIEAGRGKDADRLRALLAEWWSVTEAWSGDPALREGMYDLVRRAAPVVSPCEDADADSRPRPPDRGKFDVYRGNLGERPTGGSWTMERGVAERFAEMAAGPRGRYLGMRGDGEPTVWRGTVDAADVLGFFDDRRESEVVTDVVTDVRRVS